MESMRKAKYVAREVEGADYASLPPKSLRSRTRFTQDAQSRTAPGRSEDERRELPRRELEQICPSHRLPPPFASGVPSSPTRVHRELIS
mgnify:CR=1 FL=1